MTQTPPHRTDFKECCDFVVDLGRAAQGYGVSTMRLEAFLAKTTTAFGIDGKFIVTPSYITCIFTPHGTTQQHLRHTNLGSPDFNMAKLVDIGHLVEEISAGRLGLAQGIERLEEIRSQKPLWSAEYISLGYALSAAGFAILLGLAWSSVVFAGVLGLLTSSIVVLAGRSKWLADSLEFAAAVVVSVVAAATVIVWPGGDPFLLSLCGLVVLIPGMGLTLGLGEIFAQNIPSGLQRLTGAVMTTLKLYLGAIIGISAVAFFRTLPEVAAVPAKSILWQWVFVTLLVVGLGFIFQVARRDFVWIIFGGLLAFAGILFGAKYGYWQGSFLGSLALAAFANAFAIKLDRPASVVLLTGIMILVPGVAAYRGLATLATDSTASGLAAEWQAIVIILAIFAGQIVANSLVHPKASL